jgi:hypothetical protein
MTLKAMTFLPLKNAFFARAYPITASRRKSKPARPNLGDVDENVNFSILVVAGIEPERQTFHPKFSGRTVVFFGGSSKMRRCRKNETEEQRVDSVQEIPESDEDPGEKAETRFDLRGRGAAQPMLPARPVPAPGPQQRGHVIF